MSSGIFFRNILIGGAGSFGKTTFFNYVLKDRVSNIKYIDGSNPSSKFSFEENASVVVDATIKARDRIFNDIIEDIKNLDIIFILVDPFHSEHMSRLISDVKSYVEYGVNLNKIFIVVNPNFDKENVNYTISSEINGFSVEKGISLIVMPRFKKYVGNHLIDEKIKKTNNEAGDSLFNLIFNNIN